MINLNPNNFEKWLMDEKYLYKVILVIICQSASCHPYEKRLSNFSLCYSEVADTENNTINALSH